MENTTRSTTGATNTSAANTSNTTKPTGSGNASNQKDFYNTLGLNDKASNKDIETAYKKHAAEWHPEKHPNDRVNAQRRFNDINEAYATLSDSGQRHHYDEIRGQHFGVNDAYKLFDKFFDDNGVKDEQEKTFFEKNYPNRKPTYYESLGVPRTASFSDIQRAYRRLAVKYHPSANEGNAESEKKFIEINEAYSHLCNVFRRRNYDDVRFGELHPHNAHNIFVDFFRTNPELFEDDVQLFSDILGSKKPLNALKEPDVDALSKDAEFAESFKAQTIRQDGPGGAVGRTITSKKSIKDGKKYEVNTDEILRPNGSKVVTETVKEDGKVKVNKYEVGADKTRKEITGNHGYGQKALPHHPH